MSIVKKEFSMALDPAFVSVAIACLKTIPEAKEWAEKKLADKDPFSLEADKFVSHISKSCGAMRVLGMTESVPLRDVYINVRLSKQISARRRVPISDIEWLKGWEETAQSGKLIGGKDLVKEFDRVLVLGRPGAGKTTLLKYIALEQSLGKMLDGVIPIYIPMKRWSDSGRSLFEYVSDQFESIGIQHKEIFTRGLIRDGRALFLLDGYDEINSGKDRIINEINDLCSSGPRCKFIISCRFAANDYVFDSFTEVEVSDFCEEQINGFIDKYFKDKLTASRCKRDLDSPDNESIKSLARTPLLLALICIAYSESMSFPPSKTELYIEALEALLKKWDSSRSIVRDSPYKELTVKKKENLFGMIANSTFSKNEQFFEFRYVTKMIDEYMENLLPDDYRSDPGLVLRSIESQHGLIVERAHKVYSFSHLTFQEFFTAYHIVNSKGQTGLSEVVSDRLYDKRWSEVIYIISSLLSNATNFIKTISNSVRSIPIGGEARDVLKMLERLPHCDEYPSPIVRAHALKYILGVSLDFSAGPSLKLAFSHAESLVESLHKLYKRYISQKIIDIKILNLGMSDSRNLLDDLGKRLGEAYQYNSDESLGKYLYGNQILMNAMLSDCYMEKGTRIDEVNKFLLGVRV